MFQNPTAAGNSLYVVLTQGTDLSRHTKDGEEEEQQKGEACALRPQHLFPKSSQNDLKHESYYIPLFKTVCPHNGLQSPT